MTDWLQIHKCQSPDINPSQFNFAPPIQTLFVSKSILSAYSKWFSDQQFIPVLISLCVTYNSHYIHVNIYYTAIQGWYKLHAHWPPAAHSLTHFLMAQYFPKYFRLKDSPAHAYPSAGIKHDGLRPYKISYKPISTSLSLHRGNVKKASVNCTSNLMRVRQHPSDIWSPVHTLNANYILCP
jgi:hypothetical protein